MVRLELTLQESQFLCQWLDTPDLECPLRCQLLDKIRVAQQQALQEMTCPICNQPFTQLKAGRVAVYCSSACKQKAYRQRIYDRKRQPYPPRP